MTILSLASQIIKMNRALQEFNSATNTFLSRIPSKELDGTVAPCYDHCDECIHQYYNIIYSDLLQPDFIVALRIRRLRKVLKRQTGIIKHALLCQSIQDAIEGIQRALEEQKALGFCEEIKFPVLHY